MRPSINRSVSDSARSLGLQLRVLKAGTVEEIDTAFPELVSQQLGTLLVTADAFFLGRRTQFVALAARYRIPALYYTREFVTAGGLMSYGTNISDAIVGPECTPGKS
jgi:putative ABC transport system substrate-binding protein